MAFPKKRQRGYGKAHGYHQVIKQKVYVSFLKSFQLLQMIF